MRILKWFLIILLLASVAFFGWQNRASLNPEVLRIWISKFGTIAPFVYILLYALNTVILVPPIGLLSATAGLAFGPLGGFLAIMAGGMIGTAATFFISRRMGRDFIQARLKGRFKALDEKLETKAVATIFFLRVVYFPYEVLNYTAGLSKIRFRDYWLGTFLGLLPGAAVAAFFGSSLTDIRTNPKGLVIAVVAFVVMIGAPAVYLKLRRKPGHGID